MGAGFEVTPGKETPHGAVVAGSPFQHRGYISGIAADAPMAAKLAYTVASFTAYIACVYCKLVGTRVCGTTRYLGYREPARADKGLGPYGRREVINIW